MEPGGSGSCKLSQPADNTLLELWYLGGRLLLLLARQRAVAHWDRSAVQGVRQVEDWEVEEEQLQPFWTGNTVRNVMKQYHMTSQTFPHAIPTHRANDYDNTNPYTVPFRPQVHRVLRVTHELAQSVVYGPP